MIELSLSQITFALLGGGLISLIFFGGLKLTVEHLNNSRHPALLLICSLLLRFAMVLVVAYWTITQVHWQALLVALVGFIYVRLIVTRLITTGANK